MRPCSAATSGGDHGLAFVGIHEAGGFEDAWLGFGFDDDSDAVADHRTQLRHEVAGFLEIEAIRISRRVICSEPLQMEGVLQRLSLRRSECGRMVVVVGDQTVKGWCIHFNSCSSRGFEI